MRTRILALPVVSLIVLVAMEAAVFPQPKEAQQLRPPEVNRDHLVEMAVVGHVRAPTLADPPTGWLLTAR